MKQIQKRNYIKLFLVLLFMPVAFTLQAAITVTAVPTHGTCVSDCKITINATGTTGDVTYVLINYPEAGKQTSPQSSNVFDGLPPGFYTVGVYDATTSGVPVTATTTLTTTYVGILASPPTSGYGTASELCDVQSYNGTYRLSFTGGKAPFRMKIINNSAPNNTVEVMTTKRDTTFVGLPSGSYGFELEDACGQWQVSTGNITVQQNPNTFNFKNVNFTNVTRSRNNSYSYEYGTLGNCNRLTFYTYYSYVTVTTDGSPSSFSPYYGYATSQINFRFEYPAYSGNYSAWQKFTSTSITTTIDNYDRSINGDQYRFQVLHPCIEGTDSVITSTVYTLPPEGKFYAGTGNSETGYCSQNPYIYIYTPTTNATQIGNYVCDYPYTIKLMQGTTTVATKSLSANGSSVQFSVSDNVQAGVSYSAIITGSGGHADTIPSITVSSNMTALANRIYYYDYGYYANTNYVLPHQCKDSVLIYASFSPVSGQPPVKYILKSMDGTPLPLDTISLSRTDSLWRVPLGNYIITADFGDCGTVDKVFSKRKTITGFEAKELTYTDYPSVCGRYSLIGEAYFLDTLGNRWNSTDYEARYYMMIENGPDGIGSRASGYSSPGSTSYRAQFGNLPGGTYSVIYYPIYAPTTYKIVNGAYMYYPNDTTCHFIRQTITIDEYLRPVVNIPYSGGISCSNGTTNMTVSALQGSKPPFTYRYKVAGASDGTYAPAEFQSENVFSNITPGYYTVQVKDQCGSITTQDIRVFNGLEQFVGIVGEIAPGVVCETNQVVLSVLSIGPVEWYKWRYRKDSSEAWQEIGGNSPTYVIENVTQGHVGEYQVTIDNGLCELSSAIKIVSVAPPAGTPVISGANSFCTGGSAVLTATTTAPSPVFQWYKDGVIIEGASSSTYTATAPGSYTAKATPLNGCSSDISAAHVVTEGLPSAPTITGSSYIFCTSGTVLTANPKVPDATYKWYKDGSATEIYTSNTENTYTATAEGSYTVTVAYGEATCLSPISTAFSVTDYIINPTSGRAYVTVSGNGIGDGSSWANAHSSLANVLMAAQACSNITEIWVGAGTYYPEYNPVDGSSDNRDKSFLMLQGVKIYGGFPAVPEDGVNYIEINPTTGVMVTDTRKSLDDATPNLSVLSGDLNKDGQLGAGDAYHVVVSAGLRYYQTETATNRNARLDGFVIRGGNANGSNLVTINGENISQSVGGGVVNYGSGLVMRKMIFENNSAAQRGGAIYSSNSTVLVANATFFSNQSSEGGAVANDANSTLVLLNSLLHHNTGWNYGGAIANYYGSTAWAVNATIADNNANTDSHGLYNNAGTANVHNSIIINNGSSSMSGSSIISSDVVNTNGGTLTYRYSVLRGLTAGLTSDSNLDGQLSANLPTFVSSTDYHLTSSSKGLNAGSNALYNNQLDAHNGRNGYENRDLSDDQRFVGSAIDMGAYEESTGGGVSVDLTVFLQGPLRSHGLMSNYIQEPDPNNSSFTESRLPVSDPYGLGVSCPDINDSEKVGKVVDWVKVEIRKQSTLSVVSEAQALLLRPNGKVVDIDGTVPRFSPLDEPVHIAVCHRSHLSVVTPLISTFSGSITHDFSTGLAQAYKIDAGDTDPMSKPYASLNVWGMWAGDLNGDLNGDDIINNMDVSTLTPFLGAQDAYITTDLDMNGIVNNADASMIRGSGNVGAYSPLLSW